MIAIGLIQVAILLVSLLRAKGLAVLMGPEGVGVIGTIDQLIVTLTLATSLGMPFAAMKFMSAAASIGEEEFRDSYAAFVRVILGLALFAMICGIGLVVLAPDLLDAASEDRMVLTAAVLSVPPTMLTILIAHTLAAAQLARPAIIYNFCFASGVALSGLIGAWLGELKGFYYGTALAGTIVVIGGMSWLFQHLRLSVLRRGVSIRQQLTLRPKVISTAMTASIALVSFSATMLLVRYVVLAELGNKQTGFLQAALGLALSVGSVLSTINALKLAPSINRVQPNTERFKRANDFANRAALFMAAGAVPLALLPGLTLTILFTVEFLPAGMALILCLIWQVGHQLRVTLLQLLIGADHPLSGAFAVVVALCVTLIAVWILLEPLGILAAPVALILGDIVAIMLMFIRLSTTVEMPVPWCVLARFLASSIAILGAGLFFDSTIILPDIPGLVYRFLYAMSAFLVIWVTMPKHLSPAAAITCLRARLRR